jgi:hypothetical protein
MSERTEEKPPEIPDFPRAIRLTSWQRIGIPLLLLMPLLALFGLFGQTAGNAEVRTESLSVQIEYPARSRYETLSAIHLDIVNTGRGSIDTVVVSLDSAYAARFSSVGAIPDFERAYEVEVIDIAPGETRRVTIELDATEYGRHSGDLRVEQRGGEVARVPITTWIFP